MTPGRSVLVVGLPGDSDRETLPAAPAQTISAARSECVLSVADSHRNRLLSDAGTAPVEITTFHCNDGIDDLFLLFLRAIPTPTPGRTQHAVLLFAQHTAERQQSGRFQNGAP